MTRYELAERIGSGGMAEIFRGKALAAGGFEKPVAIKRILPQLSQDKRFVELLIAEANIVSHLRHRNIVQIFDVGLGPDGQYFLVMEFIDGADLGAMQDGLEHSNARLPIDLGLYVGSEVCEALEYAHSAYGPDGEPMRLVHRDVSPTNVLISRSGEVKLTDFGIAKRAEDVTRHGGVRGKLAYISPEQASSGRLDARSDVFSVGIMLFELLLGQRLFSQMADFDALSAVREGRIPKPRDIDPTIPPRLARTLSKALALRPDDRYSSAGELGRELRDIRYSIPATGSDPAKELANAMDRYAHAKPPKLKSRVGSEDSQMFRLNSAPGFTLAGQEELDRDKSYADARQLIDSFEEEVTRAMSRDDFFRGGEGADTFEGENNHGRQAFDDAEDAQTMIMKPRKHGKELNPTLPFNSSAAASAVAAASAHESGRQRVGFHDDDDDPTAFEPASRSPGSTPGPRLSSARPGSMSGGSSPAPIVMGPSDSPRAPSVDPVSLGMPGGGPGSPRSPSSMGHSGNGQGTGHQPGQFSPTGPVHGPMSYPRPMTGMQPQTGGSRRTLWLLALGVVAAGVGSFFIAGAVLGSDDAESSVVVDAAPVEVVPDAAPPDAGVPDAAAEPAKAKKGKKRKKRKKRKRRRKKRRR